MTPSEYWRRNNKLDHITPPGELFPEVGLYEALQQTCAGTVFEFGCGYGRLCKAFAPESYVGYDINPTAVKAAHLANPEHRFVYDPWPEAYTALAYTVLLHIPDNEICGVVDCLKTYKRVVIGEIMGRKWRRGGNPPVFNREPEEYESMIGRKAQRLYVPYPRYGCNLTLMVFDGD